MRHLSQERLSRLVDEVPEASEREHLRACDRCARELHALRDQTEALRALPSELPPPAGAWRGLERRLREEGLVRGGSARSRGARGSYVRARWLQAAAALVLFLAGSATGALSMRLIASPGSGADGPAGEAALSEVRTPEEATEVLRSAEERYVDALIRYREVAQGPDDDPEDPAGVADRYAALEGLLAASRAAIRQAPADPFFNGVLASTMAEREATLRRISTAAQDDWF